MHRAILTLGMFVAGMSLSTFAQAQDTYPGGATANVNSCYSACGGKLGDPGYTKQCNCDQTCQGRGNCCADRDEFCAPAIAKPACSLTSNANYSLFCGTDLGFVFRHGS